MELSRRNLLKQFSASTALIMAGCGGSSEGMTASARSSTGARSISDKVKSTGVSGNIIQAGDSIGAGTYSENYAAIDQIGLGSGVLVYNVSVAGRKLETGYQNRYAEIYPHYSRVGPSILVIQQGINDIAQSAMGTSLYEDITTPFVADAKRAGFYVMVNTLLGRADPYWSATNEAERLAYNLAVRRNRAHADMICNFAHDPFMGLKTTAANPDYFADGLHPTKIVQQRLAEIYAPLLRVLLRNPIRPLAL